MSDKSYVARRTFDFVGRSVKAGTPVDLSLCVNEKRARILIKYGFVMLASEFEAKQNPPQPKKKSKRLVKKTKSRKES